MVKQFLRCFTFSGFVIVAFAAQQSAHAGMVTFSAMTGGSALAGENYANFDSQTPGSGTPTTGGVAVAFTGGGAFVQGSLAGQYAAPIISGLNNQFFETGTTTGPDTTTYVSTGIGSATMTFSNGSNTYFGLLWGSIDAYNSLTFRFADSTTQTISGAAVLSSLGPNSGGTAYVNFTGSAFTSVVASSLTPSFEFDNVAYGNAVVPEPSSLVLCGLAGLAGLGVARVRRRQQTAA